LECGTLDVPIDWDEPHGSMTTIGFQRLNASNATARIGPLFFNPGGPGTAASTFINRTALGELIFGDTINEHFDLIGPDPRGVGTSSPIKCDPNAWNNRVSMFPTTEAEWTELVAWNEAFGNSCRNLTGSLIEHVDTLSNVKDWEALRVALGGEKLNYLGLSYGTLLGATYAELYPQNIRAMVLDGNMDHSQSEVSTLVAASTTYDAVLGKFAEWCESNSTCALYGQDVLQVWDDLVAAADITPIPAPECEAAGTCYPNVTGADIRSNSQSFVIFEETNVPFGLPGWAYLASALNASLHGDASQLSSGLATSETYAGFPSYPVLCIEWTHNTKTLSEMLYKEQLAKTVAPHTQGAGGTWRFQSNCIGWPMPIQYPQGYYKSSIAEAPPILMVNSLYDPETAFIWANGALAQIPSANLLVRNGSGHTSYFLFGEATELMQNYLVTLEQPAPNTVVNS
ncbi:alpha/beta hydrolase fold-domain-containing protein, partial [Talaromyces proteolyticus]